MSDRISVGVVLFDGFELLDVFGPLEMFGLLPDHFELCLIAETGDIVANNPVPRSVAILVLITILNSTYYWYRAEAGRAARCTTPCCLNG